MTWVMTSPSDPNNKNQAPKFKCICENPSDMLPTIQEEDDAKKLKALNQYTDIILSFIEFGKIEDAAIGTRMRAEWLNRTSVSIDYHDQMASAVVTQGSDRLVLYDFYHIQPNVVA